MQCIIILNTASLRFIFLQSKKIEPTRKYNKIWHSVLNLKVGQKQSELSETLQDQLNEIIIPQRLQDASLRKLY